MRLALPHALWLLLLLPLLWHAYCRHRQQGVAFSLATRASTLPGSVATRAAAVLPWFRVLAAVLMVIALARPQWGVEQTRVYREGISIAMVVDVSSSMSAPDLSSGEDGSSRLDVVKNTFHAFVEGRESDKELANDRIGMVSFARFATLLSPLTSDHGALLELLDQLSLVDIADEDGTAIGDAIATGADVFTDADEGTKVLILLTDGANNSGETFPVLAAEAARTLGVRIYTIGAGTRPEDPPRDGVEGGEYRARSVVYLDEENLQEIARVTGGRYFHAADADALRGIYSEIDRLEKTPHLVRRYQRYVEGFPLLALLAALLLLAEQALRATWLRVVGVA